MVKRSNGSKHEEYKPMKTIHLRNRYTICSMGIICLFLCVTYYLPTSVYLSSIQLQIKTTNLFGYRSLSQMDCGSQYESVKNEACSGVLSCMTSGTWKTRELTSQERTEIDTFLKGSRDVIPNNTDYQRPDLKCGNLPYAETNPRVWFRVLCNPGGPTPCCFNNRCDNKTVDECRGPMNFDLRPRVHAEYSKWQPTDKKCSVKIFDSESACNLLKGSTIYVIGDSLMRQLYTALLMIIRGDLKTGALLPNTPEGKCSFGGGGMNNRQQIMSD
ncbi:uncharacterized protein LOC121387061 [Gigantopelta aegis]|uniref:uncharacterized protein LOC121387061 n=1 Tax=Gigantopelta aegis TaxID=1735272 RepID=UPI001B889225|nr:uncharacterized protein LOC121387061 [Gigantopelta aegis]